MEKIIEDPKSFFDKLGNLHDARITALDWNREGNVLRLSVDDLSSSFLGLPEYEGRKPARLVLRGIDSAKIAIENDLTEAGIWIFGFEVSPRPGKPGLDVRITTSPGGNIDLACAGILIDTD